MPHGLTFLFSFFSASLFRSSVSLLLPSQGMKSDFSHFCLCIELNCFPSNAKQLSSLQLPETNEVWYLHFNHGRASLIRGDAICLLLHLFSVPRGSGHWRFSLETNLGIRVIESINENPQSVWEKGTGGTTVEDLCTLIGGGVVVTALKYKVVISVLWRLYHNTNLIYFLSTI